LKLKKRRKKKSDSPKTNTVEPRTSKRTSRISSSPSKNSAKGSGSSPARQLRKRSSMNHSYATDNDDDDDYVEKKSTKQVSSSKRTRKSTTDSDVTPSIGSQDSDVLDSAKLDRILDVRRDKKTNTVEYHIQLKKIKQPTWAKSDRLTEYYTQQVIDFLEEKYV